MPLGLTNALEVFMDLKNRVCKPYLDKFFILFIDDILIYSKSKEDHEVHLKLVLELLKKEKLQGRERDNRNATWPKPTNGKEGRWRYVLMMDEAHSSRYLVHSGADKTYYDLRDMYGGYIAKTLLYLTQKEIREEWAKEQEEAFQTLKGNLQGRERDNRNATWPKPTNGKEGRWRYVLMMDEAHSSRYLVHSGADKTYYDLGDMYGGYKYLADTNLHVHLEEIKVDKTLCFVEEPVEIIDREVESLKRSRIPIVKSIGTRSEFMRI
ncbi:putative reverse transcriptase domain-containing protein [Tanacetum coccineum]